MFWSRLAGGALDYAGFHSMRLDSLFEGAQHARSERELADAWRAVQRELGYATPVSWVYHARGVQGLSRRLEGVTMDLRGELATLSQWRIRDDGARRGGGT
jgi:peptide/nickel transport system substrate-binding protein